MRYVVLFALCLGACTTNTVEETEVVAPGVSQPETPVQTPRPTPADPAPPPADAPEENEIPADALLQPGIGVGPTRIGESYGEVFDRLGRPDATDAAMGKSLSTWYSGHDPKGHSTMIFFSRNMETDQTNRVRQIRVNSPWFRTAEGLGVGTTEKVLRKTYTLQPLARQAADARAKRRLQSPDGMLFELDDRGVCTAVVILSGGDGDAYLPFPD